MKEAVDAATRALSEPPTLGFLFVGSRHRLPLALAAAREAAGCDFIGCTTAGEFTEHGKTVGGVSVLLTTLEAGSFEIATATGLKLDPSGAARQLVAGFPDLVTRASRRGWGVSTSVLLVDGLAGTGEQVVNEVRDLTRSFQQIVGGAAGDDGQFKETSTGSTRQAGPDAAAAVHVFGPAKWGVGVDHGLSPKSAPMKVTRARGNVLYELDGKPALEAYQAHARARGVTLTEENTARYLVGNELGVYFLKQLHHARAAVGVLPDGALQLVATIQQGAQVCILDGEPDAMVAAAGGAAAQARDALGAAPVAGVLVFDCICRGMILDGRFEDELGAIRAHFPGVPISGFLTYGEIARSGGRLDGWHNSTTVVVAIPA